MSVSPLRINSKKSRSLYLHVWQILNKIILFLTVLSVKLPRVISRNLENALIGCSALLLCHGIPSWLKNVNSLSRFLTNRCLHFFASSLIHSSRAIFR
jgi:hypothetical protein